MATTLVESGLFPHNVPREVQQSSHSKIFSSVSLSPLELSAAQLAPLASQHHTSDYNRHKFGVQGCPVPYSPLSVQLPDYYDELQRRQVRCSQEKSWWPCHKLDSLPAVVLGPAGARPQEILQLQKELQAAIAEPLNNIPSRLEVPIAKLPLHPSIKTSSTHPINISSIVPPEILPIISSNLYPASSPVSRPPPIIFEVPKFFTLDRLTLSPARYSDSRGYRASNPYPTTNTCVLGHLRPRSNIKDALRTAINAGISAIDENIERKNIPQDKVSVFSSSRVLQRSASSGFSYSQTKLNALHPNSSSISLSLSLTLAGTPPISPSNLFYKGYKIPKKHNYSSLTTESGSDIGPSDLKNQSFAPSFPTYSERISNQPSLSIGNLFLSSCPGKKVRLQGSVKGRSGVCRDLDTDLRRMKELGVGCIICCLDDQELEFLGAPWSEYEKCARINGIDVFRIPTPEGLAPLTPAFIDTHLTQLIDTYTIRGIPMLVHCRGGVGRAGVIACCWIIKLGLCGWVETTTEPASTSFPTEPASPSEYLTTPPRSASLSEAHDCTNIGWGCHNTVRFVERVIAIVRKRRSMKAVETYEQVKFLVDFVEYLKEGAMAS